MGDDEGDNGVLDLVDSKVAGQGRINTYKLERDFGIVTLRLQYELLPSGALKVLSTGSETVFNDGQIVANSIPIGTLFPCKFEHS